MKPPRCPKCYKADQVIPIMYGMPIPEAFKEAERGEIKLGGCCIDEDSPHWYCKRCEKEF